MLTSLALGARRYRISLIGAAIVSAALSAVVLIPRETAPAHPVEQAPAPVIMAVAASRPIAAGILIVGADIRLVPAGSDTQAAIRSSDAALGRIAARNIQKGEMLQQSDLRDVAAVGIASRVTMGHRAFSMRVAEDDIVGGFLQSGDRVDITAIIPGSVFPAKNAQDLSDRSQSVLLLQNILILAVGERPKPRVLCSRLPGPSVFR